jgi:hypothetical protein
MSKETTESGHAQAVPLARQTKTISVQARPGAPLPIRPKTLTLTNNVHRVVWQCADLPPNARLEILFAEDPRGPFFLLEPTGSEVIGWGNRGPKDTLKRYTYKAAIHTSAGTTGVGTGFLANQATKPIPMGIDPEPREPPAV